MITFSTISNEAGLVASGVERVSGMCVAGRFMGRTLIAEAFARVAYEFVEYGRRFVEIDEL